MPITRVLIAVKTYPTLSEKYDELVCTAGFLEDGTWIRIYPIPFRKLSYDKRYSKWQWIELEIVDFVWEESPREWDKKILDAIYAKQAQQNLFDAEETKRIFKVVKKLPYEFSYKFISKDGKERKLMIEDWELGMLYWNCLNAADGNEQIACEKVKEKYFTEWCKKDVYFFLGTTKKFHNIAPNPFIIIGTFYPPKNPQLILPF